jgi:hypothetical protein
VIGRYYLDVLVGDRYYLDVLVGACYYLDVLVGDRYYLDVLVGDRYYLDVLVGACYYLDVLVGICISCDPGSAGHIGFIERIENGTSWTGFIDIVAIVGGSGQLIASDVRHQFLGQT